MPNPAKAINAVDRAAVNDSQNVRIFTSQVRTFTIIASRRRSLLTRLIQPFIVDEINSRVIAQTCCVKLRILDSHAKSMITQGAKVKFSAGREAPQALTMPDAISWLVALSTDHRSRASDSLSPVFKYRFLEKSDT
jgi:hypothetical protein